MSAYKYFMFKFNRIVSYGCSHMSALETIDSKYFEDAEKIKKEKGYPYFRKLLSESDGFDYDRYVEKSKIHSWPVLLSKKFNVDILNRANPGNSIYKIIWDFESDLSSGIVTTEDLIIIDLVSPYRFIDFTTPMSVDTMNLNWPWKWKEDLRNGSQYIMKLFTDDFLIFNYILSLKYLNSYNKEYRIYFTVPHKENLQFLKSKNLNTLNDMNDKIYKELDIITDKTLLNDCVFDKQKDRYYTIGHAKPIVHERYAELIYKLLLLKLNDA